jgi:REP-associated tyrosine transposase
MPPFDAALCSKNKPVSHTYISGLVHCVFSTKLLSSEIQPELWAFLGGIARKNGCKALIVGGTENHVHILLSLPPTIAVAKAVQLLRGASSRSMNEKHTRDFAEGRFDCPDPISVGASSQA